MRSIYCGNVNLSAKDTQVTLCGWVNRRRDLGGLIFIDLRDRTGIVQVVFEPDNQQLHEVASTLRNEFCICVKGTVKARPADQINSKMATGEIEVYASELKIFNKAAALPLDFNQENTEEQRLRYRYLDLRRPQMVNMLTTRAKITHFVREFMDSHGFLDIETPMLTKATPEGARDYLVPSRVHHGKFYALPQSPQLFKQLLMIAGYDRYYQIVKCFRDEDLRADRQPEFTQIDCEMSFVEQEDVLQMFEGLAKHLFHEVKGLDFDKFPRITWHDAMRLYGSDKPDIRFGMQFVELNDVTKGKGFGLFDNAEIVVGICAEGCAEYTRKQLDALTDFVKRPQVGAGGMVYIKYNADGSFKSSVDKFYTPDDLKTIADKFEAKPGDLMLILCGPAMKTRIQLCALRLEMGQQLGLRNPEVFAPLWVVDFPLLEWDDETQRFYAMHHPFTAPKPEDELLLDDPSKWGDIRANAYDIVMNGVEVGGGSIRIHDRTLQNKMFHTLGFTDEQAAAQFGFLMDAFTYGAPPHAGLAFGFDRLCSLFGGADSIRDFIAFPKNNSGRDVMSCSPSPISDAQLEELQIKVDLKG
jgi:aspartyl-tRNA synthetase